MGTHPIFESDFDCLTDAMGKSISRLGSSLCGIGVIQINGEKYILHSQLGEGAFSYVDLVERLKDGKQFALKRIICHDRKSEDEAIREAKLSSSFLVAPRDQMRRFLRAEKVALLGSVVGAALLSRRHAVGFVPADAAGGRELCRGRDFGAVWRNRGGGGGDSRARIGPSRSQTRQRATHRGQNARAMRLGQPRRRQPTHYQHQGGTLAARRRFRKVDASVPRSGAPPSGGGQCGYFFDRHLVPGLHSLFVNQPGRPFRRSLAERRLGPLGRPIRALVEQTLELDQKYRPPAELILKRIQEAI